MQLRPLHRVTARFTLITLLMAASPVVAQPAPAAGGDSAAARASCEAALAAGRYGEALPDCQAVLQAAEKLLGPDHEDVANWLLSVGRVQHELGQYAKAEPLFLRSLKIREQALGPGHPDVATNLNNLAGLYLAQGQYAQAEPLFLRSLKIGEKVLGPEHSGVAQSLNNLAELYRAQGQYAQAEPLFLRSLKIWEKALSPEHPNVATSLNNLALLYEAQGQYAQAEPLFLSSLKSWEKALGSEHPDVAGSLNNMAALYEAQGQYAKAEPLYLRSLRIWEKALGPEHPDVATSLNNLAALYSQGEQPSRVVPLLARLLEQVLRRRGIYSKAALMAIDQLAAIHVHLGQGAEASAVFDRLWAALRAAPAPTQPVPDSVVTRLARLLERGFFQAWLLRRFDVAEERVAQVRKLPLAKTGQVAAALGRMQAQLDATPVGVRRMLASHAAFAQGKDDSHALRLFGRAIEESAQAQPDSAARFLVEGLYQGERHLRRQRSLRGVREWLASERPYLDLIFDLVRQQPQHAALRRLAWTASLLSKGRSLDAETTALRVLRSPQVTQSQAGRVKRQQALAGQAHRLALAGQGGTELRDVQQQRMQTTELMLESVTETRLETLPEPFELLRTVADALPKDGVMVDYVEYVPPRLGPGEAPGKRRYLALLLFPPDAAGERTQVLDLGDAEPHDAAIQRFLTDLRSTTSDPIPSAQKVHKLLLAPVLAAAGQVQQVYVIPDGALHLIPFDALHDGRTYVLDSPLRVRYLASGRDLIHSYGVSSGRPPLVLGDPDMWAMEVVPPAPEGKPGSVAAKKQRGSEARAANMYEDLRNLPALPNAREEAREVSTLLQVPSLLGAQANESALRAQLGPGRAPRVLHLATHGLFLDDALALAGTGARNRSRLVPVVPELVPPPPTPTGSAGPAAGTGKAAGMGNPMTTSTDVLGPALDDPMLRSALALSGAARAQQAEDSRTDGVLTADEVRELSLEGTELAVLSACQTALGSVQAGDGVYGLRRAFLAAGAEAVVASLWRVADPETRSLMTRYYKLLIQEKDPRPRITAMREAMLAMKKDRPHPYYWAPFIAIGRDEPLRPLAHTLRQSASSP